MDLPTPTPGFLPRKSPDGEMSFDPDTLKPRAPKTADVDGSSEPEPTDASEAVANDAPLALEKNPIPWPKQDGNESTRACEVSRPAPAPTSIVVADTDIEQEEVHGPEYIREM
jgi:hypothetical protein